MDQQDGTIPTKPLNIKSTKDLEALTAQWAPLFESKESEANWDQRRLAIIKISRLAHGNAPKDFRPFFIAFLRSNLDGNIKAIESLRTSLSNIGLSSVQYIVEALGHDADFIVDLVLDKLITRCCNTNKVKRDTAIHTVEIIVGRVTCNKNLLHHIVSASQHKDPNARTAVPTWILALLRDGGRHCNHPGVLDLVEICIKNGLKDSKPLVRNPTREVFATFASLWPDRAQKLRDSLDNGTQKLLDSGVSKAPSANKTPSRPSVREIKAALRAQQIPAAASQAPQAPQAPQSSVISTTSSTSAAPVTSQTAATTITSQTSAPSHTSRPPSALSTHTSRPPSALSTHSTAQDTESQDEHRPRSRHGHNPSVERKYRVGILNNAPIRPHRGFVDGRRPHSKVLLAASHQQASYVALGNDEPVEAGPSGTHREAVEPAIGSASGEARHFAIHEDAPEASMLGPANMIETLPIEAHQDEPEALADIPLNTATTSVPSGASNVSYEVPHVFPPIAGPRITLAPHALENLNPGAVPNFAPAETQPMDQTSGQTNTVEHQSPAVLGPLDVSDIISADSQPVQQLQPAESASNTLEPDSVQTSHVVDIPSIASTGSLPLHPAHPAYRVPGQSDATSHIRSVLQVREAPPQAPGPSRRRSGSTSDSPSAQHDIDAMGDDLTPPQPETNHRERFALVEVQQENKSAVPRDKNPEKAKSDIASAIEKIRRGKMDDFGYRKVQNLVKLHSAILADEDLIDKLFIVLLAAIENPPELAPRGGRAYDNKFQVLHTIRIVLTHGPKYCGAYHPRVLAALIGARAHFDTRCHVVGGLETTASEVIALCDPLEVLDAVLDSLEIQEYDTNRHRTVPFGLNILTNLVRRLEGDITQDPLLEQRLTRFALSYLRNQDSQTRRSTIVYCLELKRLLKSEKRFYRLLTGGHEDLTALLAYYVATTDIR